MLHDESCLHSKLSPFLDGEWFRFEGFNRARSSQVDGDIGTVFDFQGKRLDDAAPLVFGIDWNWGRIANAQGRLPAV